ncbi:peptidoglycan D,D-transpeptidase FtsI family protein [Tessaracoccus sp. Y1736]
MVTLAVLLGIAGVRAVQLQGIDAQAFAAEAAAKMKSTRDLPATRGTITDRNGAVMAATEPAMIVSIDPDMIRTNGADKRYAMSAKKQEEAAAAPSAVADILVEHLGGQKSTYLKLINTPDSLYEIVKRKVPAATYTAIQKDMKEGFGGDGSRPWKGVFGDPDPIRVYPNRSVAANVVGFVNGEGEGAAGLEYALNADLNGTAGSMVYDWSTYGRIPLGTNIMTPAVDGNSYQTTLDSDLNWMTEQILAEYVKQAGATTGKALVMNVKTGEILSLANGPGYDAANPGRADTSDLGNRAVTEAYEPGSVQKVVTMAALADQGLVTPTTKVVVPERIASGAGYVRDSFDHGRIKLTGAGVVAQSSNIGTILLARQMEKATLAEYLAGFGLGTKSGVGLPGETSGSLPGADMADYTRDQISFGQALSVNAIQMAAAVNTVANGGVYVQPTILKSATAADGTPVELPEPVTRRVVSEEASDTALAMMESVITLNENRAIPGYRTAGKSGTAQRFDPSCKCYNGFTASFVGVAPAEDPQILVYVVLDQPTNGNLGSRLALPAVNDILELALPRYNVAPSTTPAPEIPLTFE